MVSEAMELPQYVLTKIPYVCNSVKYLRAYGNDKVNISIPYFKVESYRGT